MYFNPLINMVHHSSSRIGLKKINIFGSGSNWYWFN